MVLASVVATFVLGLSAFTQLASSLKLNATHVATTHAKSSTHGNPNPMCTYDGEFGDEDSRWACSSFPIYGWPDCMAYNFYFDSEGNSPGEPGNNKKGYACCNCVCDSTTVRQTVTASCTIVEDPHITSFDDAQVSLLGTTSKVDNTDGDSADNKWLVKSERVKIQAHFAVDMTLPEKNMFVRALAVGGDLIKGNILIIPSLENDITWNGVPVLQNQDSSFKVHVGNSTLVKARRSMHSLQATDLSKENPGVNIKLPSGVRLLVNRLHHHVNVVITMSSEDGSQEGLCGNFNGLGADDSLELAAHRQALLVLDEESFFRNTQFA